MIVDLKLPYPSGLATAVLINGFHTQGDKMAKYLFFSIIYGSYNCNENQIYKVTKNYQNCNTHSSKDSNL